MRPLPRSRTAARPLAIGLTIAVAAATPAGAFIDCCLIHSGPSFLAGFSFHIADTQDADVWAERFGFGIPGPPQGHGDPTRILMLPRGVLQWSSQPPFPIEQMDTRIGMPLAWHLTACVSDPIPSGEPPENLVGYPPNGARRPLRAIAVTARNAQLVDAFTFRHAPDWKGSPVFAGCFPAPEIGAVVCDARFENGYYRFITPTDSTGIAAHWLADGPPRWLGIAFEVGDAAATERALAARGVATVRARERYDAVVRVMPEETGGPLLEFIEPLHYR